MSLEPLRAMSEARWSLFRSRGYEARSLGAAELRHRPWQRQRCWGRAGATAKGAGWQPRAAGREAATSQPFWSVWQMSPAPLLRGHAVTSHGCGPALHRPAATAGTSAPPETHSHLRNVLGNPPAAPGGPFRERWRGACHLGSGAASHPHPTRSILRCTPNARRDPPRAPRPGL